MKFSIKTLLQSAYLVARDWLDSRIEEATPQNRYESAYQFWGQRGYLPGTVQDARYDADASTRVELVRRSRYWERNSAILQRLIDLFEQFTTGPHGLHVVPSSSDEDFNDAASAWWRSWSRFPAIDNKQPLATLQSLMARSWFVDGEIFVYKTYGDSGRPRLQLVEAHRVATPQSLKDQEGTKIIDGVEIDKVGRPIAYYVREMDFTAAGVAGLPGQGTTQAQTQTFRRVPADRMFHLFEPTRPGQYRGLPMAYAVLNDVQDLYELQHLEMRAARDAARVTNVVTNKTGEANPSASRRNKWAVTTQDAAGNAVSKTIPVFHELTMGGETVYQIVGEKFEQFKSERPSVTTTEYWNYLTSKVAIGIGIPKQLVIPYSIQGTALRADIETAAAYFKSRSTVVGAIMREIFIWCIGWAKDFDQNWTGPATPDDWTEVTIRPPKSINVDVGRNSAALLSELEAGIRTRAEICAELGHDWREVLRQKCKEEAYINQLVEEYKDSGVTREQIAMLAKSVMQPQPEAPPGKNGPPQNLLPPLVVKNGNGHSDRFTMPALNA